MANEALHEALSGTLNIHKYSDPDYPNSSSYTYAVGNNALINLEEVLKNHDIESVLKAYYKQHDTL